MRRVSTGKQPARQLPIAFIDCGALWCTCDTTMADDAIPDACPGCGRDTKTLLEEADVNAQVTAFIERLPVDWGLPQAAEAPLDWWARMTASYQEALPTSTIVHAEKHWPNATDSSRSDGYGD